MTPVIHKIEDRTNQRPRILFNFQARYGQKKVEYFQSIEEARLFVRGFEAGVESALLDAANEAARLNHQQQDA